MVYLIRTVRVKGDWEKMESVIRRLLEFWKKRPEVRMAEAWDNIAGRQDEFRFVVKFDSLADEEKFAVGLWEDKDYEKVMKEFVSVFEIGTDELFRAIG